jgi:aryl-alcohol dehydrogenase
MDGSSTFSLNGEKISSPFFGQSSFSQRAIVSGRSAVKVDETLPLDILCSLGCGLQTGAGTVLNVLKPSVGSTLVIFGVGAVGMAGIMAARLTPVSNIVAVDIVDTKLKLAVELGATYTINAKDRDVSQDIKALNGGKGFNFAFDTTGNLKIIQTMIDSAPPMSVIASVGASLPGETVRIEPATWVTRGVTYTGAHQGSSVPQEVHGSFPFRAKL